MQAFKAGADAEFCHEDDDSIWEACIDIDTGGNGTGEHVHVQKEAWFEIRNRNSNPIANSMT